MHFIIIAGLVYLVLILDSIRRQTTRAANHLSFIRSAVEYTARETTVIRQAKVVRS